MKKNRKKTRTNRKYKDSVFQLLFHEKEELLELFNALEGTDYQDASIISVETLQAALYNQAINDLAFAVGNLYIVLTEHQATWNENMAARFLLYVAKEFEKLLDLDMLHKTKRHEIPTPHFYVLYNGTRKMPPITELKLSDSYCVKEVNPMLELTVKVININAEEQNPILKRSPTLCAYSQFIHAIRENITTGMDRDEAVETAIKTCIKEGVLSTFLQKHGSEVSNAMFREFTWEDIANLRVEEALEDAVEEATKKVTEQVTEQVTTQITARAIQTLIESFNELGICQEDAKKKVMDKYLLSEEDAELKMQKYWNM